MGPSRARLVDLDLPSPPAMQAHKTMTEGSFEPLGIVLYPVIFSAHPVDDVERVAVLQRGRDPMETRALVAAIDDELAHPTRRVSEILPSPLATSEEAVREYLRQLAAALR